MKTTTVPESIQIGINTSKEDIYLSIIPQIEALIHEEDNLISNLANISAALKEAFGFFWVGFYVVRGHELQLGPFQGPVACTRIGFGKGVCGKAWKEKTAIIVPNVENFPGHIACSSFSKSEIVIPVFKNHDVTLILDIDSDQLNSFDEIDKKWLKKLADIIEITL